MPFFFYPPPDQPSGHLGHLGHLGGGVPPCPAARSLATSSWRRAVWSAGGAGGGRRPGGGAQPTRPPSPPPLAPPTSLWKSTRVPLVLFPILGEPQYLRKAAVPAGGRAVPRHAGRGAYVPPRLVSEGRGACEFGRTFRSLQDCGYLDFTLYEIPMIWFRSGVFHRG